MPEVTVDQMKAMEDPEEAERQAALEREKADALAKAGGGNGATPTPDETLKELEALEKKVELGQDLTEDEQKRLDELEKQAPEPLPDVKYRIAGQELTYADAVAKMREETGIGQVDLGREAEQKLTETWVRATNKSEQSKRAERDTQLASRAREGVIETARQLQARERLIAEEYARAGAMLDLKKEKRADLEEQRRDLERLIALKPQDGNVYNEDGTLNLQKQSAAIAAIQAEERLKAIQQKEQQIKTEEEQLAKKVKDTENGMAFLEIEQFITNVAPEFYPETTDFATAFSKYSNGVPMDDADWLRMHELTSILQQRDSTGADITKIYSYMKNKGQLTVKGAQSSNGRGLPSPKSKDEDLIKRITKLRERRSAAPQTMPAGAKGTTAAPGGVKSPEQAALDHIQSERIADGVNKVDKSVFDGKITNPQRVAGT